MARKTVLVCDQCGTEVDEKAAATVKVSYADARRNSVVGDYCEACAGTVKGRTIGRAGRRPKVTAEAA